MPLARTFPATRAIPHALFSPPTCPRALDLHLELPAEIHVPRGHRRNLPLPLSGADAAAVTWIEIVGLPPGVTARVSPISELGADVARIETAPDAPLGPIAGVRAVVHTLEGDHSQPLPLTIGVARGYLDPSFGVGGIARHELGVPELVLGAAAIDADGSVVLGGHRIGRHEWGVARVDGAGRLAQPLRTHPAVKGTVDDLVLDGDGAPILIGRDRLDGVRWVGLDAAGELGPPDLTSAGGAVFLRTASVACPRGVLTAFTGRLDLSPIAQTRLVLRRADGSIDPDVGDLVTPGLGTPVQLAVDRAGRIVLVTDRGVARFTADGRLDQRFAAGGWLDLLAPPAYADGLQRVLAIGPGDALRIATIDGDACTLHTVDAAGRAIATTTTLGIGRPVTALGWTADGGLIIHAGGGLVRLDAVGALDPTFGDGGRVRGDDLGYASDRAIVHGEHLYLIDAIGDWIEIARVAL